jgi:putative glycosyltransferase (TIGR04372 family)
VMCMKFNHRIILLFTFWIVARKNFLDKGVVWAIKGIFKRLILEILWITLLPASTIGHVMGFRVLNVRVEHIGHLALEPDTLLKEYKLGILRQMRWILLAPPNKVANEHLLSYWIPFFKTVRSPYLCSILRIMSKHIFMREDVSRYISRFFEKQDIYEINAEWGERPPLISLSEDDDNWGNQQLLELGVPPGSWFVAIHAREAGFLPKNEVIQSHRNANINNTFLAMQEIIRRGGTCIRMGDSTMTPLKEIPGVIDYPFHRLKSSRLDVVLCAKAKFFLGSTSGLAFVSSIFGVPIAHANMIPVETLGIRYCDLSIPKFLWSNRLNRYLTYKEIFSLGYSSYFFSHQYANAGIRVDENTAEDIQDLAIEMMERLNGSHLESEQEKARQLNYLELFQPDNYSWGAKSKICNDFLTRHRNLL